MLRDCQQTTLGCRALPTCRRISRRQCLDVALPTAGAAAAERYCSAAMSTTTDRKGHSDDLAPGRRVKLAVQVDEFLVSLLFLAHQFGRVLFGGCHVLRRRPEMQFAAVSDQDVVPPCRGALVAADGRRSGEAKRRLSGCLNTRQSTPAADTGCPTCQMPVSRNNCISVSLARLVSRSARSLAASVRPPRMSCSITSVAESVGKMWARQAQPNKHSTQERALPATMREEALSLLSGLN
jgi:hypothetical protein